MEGWTKGRMSNEPPEYLTKLNKEFPEEYVPLARAECRPLILRESLGKGRKRYFCTHCDETYELEAFNRTDDDTTWVLWTASHGGSARCPKCGHTCEVIDGKRWALGRHWYYAPLVVRVQLKEKRQAILCFDIARALGYNEISGFFQHIEASLDDIYLLDEGCAAHYKYYRYLKRYCIDKYKDSVSEKFRGGFGEPFSNHTHTTSAMFYEVHDVGRWDYSRDILRYMPVSMKAKTFAPCASMAAFACYPALEMICKSGFEDIVHKVVTGKKCVKICNIKGRSFKEVFPKFTKQEIKGFDTNEKRQVVYIEHYIDARKHSEKNTKHLMELLSFWQENFWDDKVMEQINRPPFKAIKAVRYFNKIYDSFLDKAPRWACAYWGGGKSMNRIYLYWLDYIKAARAIGFDLTREDVVFPKDLEERHDVAVKLHQDMLAKEQEKAFEKVWRKNEKLYGYSDGEFVIINPKSTIEIIEEGKAQAHCVGGYANRHAQGTLSIVFIRKVGEEDKAFLTVEMHKERMQQIQGKANKYILSDHERAFVDKWLEVVKSRINKKERKNNYEECRA